MPCRSYGATLSPSRQALHYLFVSCVILILKILKVMWEAQITSELVTGLGGSCDTRHYKADHKSATDMKQQV